MPAYVQHGLAYGLAGEQIIAEPDRIEPGIPRAVRRQPSPRGSAFTVLLVVAVLRDNELRLQRHDPVVARCDNRGGQHGVEILGLVLAAFAVGTLRATDFVRAMEFRSVQRDQHPPIRHRMASRPPHWSSSAMRSANMGWNLSGSIASSFARIWLSPGILRIPNRV